MAHGKFVWYELMTSDTKAAEAFYRNVIGWNARDSGMPGMSYNIWSAGEAPVGGLMEVPKAARDAGAGPAWVGYVEVDDVDASAAKAKRDGGVIHRAPDDIPGVGRFAIMADPGGATLCLFKGTFEPQMPPPAAGTPGTAGWRELYAADLETALGFYSKLFGWTKAEHHDMGRMGVYQMFATGGETIGGMMTKPPAVFAPLSAFITRARSGWLYYFKVDAIDAATSHVQPGGGEILNGPVEVPGGHWIAHCRDPQGAVFCLVAPRR